MRLRQRAIYVWPWLLTLGAAGVLGCEQSPATAPSHSPAASAPASSPASRSSPDAPAKPDGTLATGETLYLRHCALCHQHDGSGIPQRQPALRQSAIVLGEPQRLIEVTLWGVGIGGRSAKVSGKFNGIMPGVAALKDDQVAALLTWLRQAWNHTAGPINAGQVAAVRSGNPTGPPAKS